MTNHSDTGLEMDTKGRVLDCFVEMSVADGLPSLDEAQEELRAMGVDPEALARSVRERLSVSHIANMVREHRAMERQPTPRGMKLYSRITIGSIAWEVGDSLFGDVRVEATNLLGGDNGQISVVLVIPKGKDPEPFIQSALRSLVA